MSHAARRRAPDPLVVCLRQLEARIADVEARVGLTGPLPRVSPADEARLGVVLPAIVGVFGSGTFVVAEIIGSQSAPLRVATEGLSARQLGRLLRRAARVATPVEGYHVHHCGHAGTRAIWTVERVVQFPARENCTMALPDLRASRKIGA